MQRAPSDRSVREYQTPELVTFGDLATLTQGSGGSCADSGANKSSMHKAKTNGRC